MSHTVAVTGATGHVGAPLVRALRERGIQVRAIGRNEERLKVLAAGVDARVAALDDTAALTRAFDGADAVFAMIPPSYGEPDYRSYQRRLGDSIARAVEAAKVPRVVTLSSVGAEHPEGTGLIAGAYDFEKRLEAIPGLHIVHLRPTYFMENELGNIGLIRSAGINGSAIQADRPVAIVASRDIAAAAAGLLSDPGFTGRSFRELLGPRDYTPREITRILGESIGRPDLPHVEFTYDDLRKALLGAGFSADVAGKFVEMITGTNTGHVRPLRGRPDGNTPTTLETFAREVFSPAFGS